MTPLQHPIRVLAAMITRGDRYLVCQRPLTKRHGGLWKFPGGKLEPISDARFVQSLLALSSNGSRAKA